MTGESGSAEAKPAPAPLAGATKPLCVLVSDNPSSEDEEKFQTLTLKAEKVALGLKAFRTVRLDSTQAAADPLLAEAGKDVPRLILIDPTEPTKATVLAKSRLSASAVYAALESASGRFYVEKLDKVVKSHLDLLCEQDQLVNKQKTLAADLERAGAKDGAKAEKAAAEVKAELEQVRQALDKLAGAARDLWKLTPKSSKPEKPAKGAPPDAA